MTKPPGNEVIASIHLKGADKWTPKYRKEVALWMRRCGESLIKHGHNYSSKFVHRKMRAK